MTRSAPMWKHTPRRESKPLCGVRAKVSRARLPRQGVLRRLSPVFCLACFIAIAGCSQPAGDHEIAVVVKVGGIPWFNRMEEGVRQAGKELGVDAYLIGPTQADEAQQVKMVEDLISKGVDAICVVPNDSASLEPVFDRARRAGIVVLTHESPQQKNHDYNIEAVRHQEFARHFVDKLVETVGPRAEYAVFVGSLTAPTHKIWADEAIRYAQESHPDLTLVTERIPCAEQMDLSKQKTLELIQAYPDLKGIIAFGSLGPPGAAQALEEKGLADKIAVIGTVIPSQGAPYLRQGSMRHGALWDPKPVGYALVAVADALLDGQTVTAGMDLPGMGRIGLEGRNIELDGMLEITQENAASLGF